MTSTVMPLPLPLRLPLLNKAIIIYKEVKYSYYNINNSYLLMAVVVAMMTWALLPKGQKSGSQGKIRSSSPLLLRHVIGQVRSGRGRKGKRKCWKQGPETRAAATVTISAMTTSSVHIQTWGSATTVRMLVKL